MYILYVCLTYIYIHIRNIVILDFVCIVNKVNMNLYSKYAYYMYQKTHLQILYMCMQTGHVSTCIRCILYINHCEFFGNI